MWLDASRSPLACELDTFPAPCVDVVSIHDPVAVALFGQEALAVLGEVRINGVAGDDRVEVRSATIGLRAQYSTEALSLLLPGAECAGDLNRHGGFWQVDGEVGNLAHHKDGDLPIAEGLEEPFALLNGRSAAVVHGDSLVVPYGMSDWRIRFATVQLTDLISALS